VRVERAQRESRRRNPPPLPQRVDGDAAGLHYALGGDGRDRVAQRQMRRHEDHAQPPGRQHHRHRQVTREVGQEFRNAGIPVAGGVQSELVNGTCDDCVYFPGEGEARCLLDSARRYAAGLEIVGGAVFPAAHDADLRVERLAQRFADDFRTDPARVAHGNREARPGRSHAYSLITT
jgi:hypothetical protein